MSCSQCAMSTWSVEQGDGDVHGRGDGKDKQRIVGGGAIEAHLLQANPTHVRTLQRGAEREPDAQQLAADGWWDD